MVVIGTTQNPSENFFRKIRLLDNKGNDLTFITNRFNLNALAQLSTNSTRSHLQMSRFLKASLWKSNPDGFVK